MVAGGTVGGSVAVGGSSVGFDVAVGVLTVGTGVEVKVGIGVVTFVKVGGNVDVKAALSSFVFVGGKILESKETGVGEGVRVGPETGIITNPNVAVASLG